MISLAITVVVVLSKLLPVESALWLSENTLDPRYLLPFLLLLTFFLENLSLVVLFSQKFLICNSNKRVVVKMKKPVTSNTKKEAISINSFVLTISCGSIS